MLLRCFNYYLGIPLMHNLEVFAAKVYSKKTFKGNILADLRWDVYLHGLLKIRPDMAHVRGKN